MRASPQCFSILTHMLKGIAQGRLVMALEVKSYYGIYFSFASISYKIFILVNTKNIVLGWI